MKQRPRIHYTESQKALMWERWKQGDSLQMIAQLSTGIIRRSNRYWRKRVAHVRHPDAARGWP